MHISIPTETEEKKAEIKMDDVCGKTLFVKFSNDQMKKRIVHTLKKDSADSKKNPIA